MSTLTTLDALGDLLEDMHDTLHHTSSIFPANTNLTCTFTANATVNTYSSWVEIGDSASTKFSAAFADAKGHVTSMLIEDVSEVNTLYMMQLAYGDAKTLISSVRFAGGTKFQAPDTQSRFWAPPIPAGETFYYRMKTATSAADTCLVHFRYHLH